MNREMRRKLGKIDTAKLENKVIKELNKALDRCECPLQVSDTLRYMQGYIDCLYNFNLVSERFVNEFLERYSLDLTGSVSYGKVNFNE